MKLDELKTAIGEVLAEQISELKQPAGRKAFVDEAGGPDKAVGYLKQASFYAKALGVEDKFNGVDLKAITDDIVYTGANGQGGYLNAPAETMAEIARIGKEASAVMRLARKFTQNSDTLYVPTDTSDLTFTVTNESVAKTSTKPTFTRATLSLKKAAALIVVTDEMISGSVVDMVDYLNTRLGEDYGEFLDTSVLGASATSPFDNIAHVSGTNSVTLESDGPDWDKLIDVTASIKSKALRKARFFMDRTTFAEIRKVKGTDGQPIFQAGLAGQPGSILGYPVELIDVMPTYSDATSGEMVALFGDLSYWYMGQGAAFNIGVSREASVTLDSTLTSLWENNMVGIRAEALVSGALVLPSAFCKVLVA